MKTDTAVAMVAVLLLGGWTWAGDNATNQPPPVMRLELDLADGSHIIGIPKIESVPLQTAYARMDIVLKQILTIKMADDHETASVDLQNGDKLKGVISLAPIELVTVFGPVRVGIEHLRGIAVVAPVEGLSSILARGLVLYYPCDRDEADKATDKSGKKNDGSIKGAVWASNRKSGGAYRCGPTSGYIDLGSSETLKLAKTDFSIVAWINLNSYNHIYNGIIGSAPWAAQGKGYYFGVMGTEYGAPGRLQGVFYTTEGSSHIMSPQKTIEPGTWYQVAWVWSSKDGHRLCVNGQALSDVEVSKSSGLMADYTPSVWLGVGWREQGHYNRGLNGLLDEVMIFERALSEAEVKALYSARKPYVAGP